MAVLLLRLFLLALLGIDWTADTHFGTDLFSTPMASSPASLDDSGPVRCGEDHSFRPTTVVPPLVAGVILPLTLERASLPLHAFPFPIPHDRIYVLMELQL
jgi:hypothetical protein